MRASSQSRGPRGAALIAVLWLIAILSMACMATMRVIQFDSALTAAKIHGSTAGQLAEQGIAIGSNPVVKRSDPILHYHNEETDEGYDVKVITEGGRLNLNYILMSNDKELLRTLFVNWGMELEEAQALTDALGDWVDANDETSLNGAEKDYYEKLGRLNQPFNRPFYNLSEARLVRGMDRLEALRPNWQDSFTIWSSGKLDLNEASAELIAAAADISVDQAEVIPETVRGPDGILDTADDVPFKDAQTALSLLGGLPENVTNRFDVNETTTRIESTGFTPGATRRITLIVRNRTGNPALLERTEEIIPTP